MSVPAEIIITYLHVWMYKNVIVNSHSSIKYRKAIRYKYIITNAYYNTYYIL